MIRSLDNDGVSSLYVASEKGHVRVVEMLLSHGADINSRDGNKRRCRLLYL